MLFCEKINRTIKKLMNIKELRTKIDKIDADILNLLDQRMDIVHENWITKKCF